MFEQKPGEPGQVGQFFASQWGVYDRLVRANLLFHKELFEALREDLLKVTPNFSLLDLGCGDAGCLAKALAGMRVSRCVAVDLAGGPVLLAARDNLRFRGIPAEVKQGNALEFVEVAPKRKFDAVIMAYCLHHFPTADKARFFKGVANWVKPGGALWLLDEVIPGGASREDWLRLELQLIHRLGAETLTSEEWAGVDQHITTSDFPETVEAYGEMAREAGFQSVETRLTVADGLAAMLRFTR